MTQREYFGSTWECANGRYKNSSRSIPCPNSCYAIFPSPYPGFFVFIHPCQNLAVRNSTIILILLTSCPAKATAYVKVKKWRETSQTTLCQPVSSLPVVPCFFIYSLLSTCHTDWLKFLRNFEWFL